MSMLSSPARQLSRVVLPQPDGPMTATISPRLISSHAAQRVDFHAARVVGLMYVARFYDDILGVWICGTAPFPLISIYSIPFPLGVESLTK